MLPWFSRLFFRSDSPDVTQSLITILLVTGLGVFIGRLKLRKVSLGVSAVMLVGLILAHFATVYPPVTICRIFVAQMLVLLLIG